MSFVLFLSIWQTVRKETILLIAKTTTKDQKGSSPFISWDCCVHNYFKIFQKNSYHWSIRSIFEGHVEITKERTMWEKGVLETECFFWNSEYQVIKVYSIRFYKQTQNSLYPFTTVMHQSLCSMQYVWKTSQQKTSKKRKLKGVTSLIFLQIKEGANHE